MFLSLIVAAGVIVQAMAYNYTYIPGFFVQDDPNANATEIGAVSYTDPAYCTS
jgi:hypothetical protein